MGLAIKIYGVSFEDNNIGQVTEALPIESITIGSDVYVYNNENAAVCKATITPDNTPDKNVIWSITDGSSYASIDQTGKLTILSGADGNSVTVKAVSRINPEVFATITVRVKYANNLSTTGIYGYYRDSFSPFIKKASGSHACLIDTTLREIDEGATYIGISSNVGYVFSGYVYLTVFDDNFNIIATMNTVGSGFGNGNPRSYNVGQYADRGAKYVSFSFDFYDTTSETLSIMDALKNAYANAVISYAETTISLENFITID